LQGLQTEGPDVVVHFVRLPSPLEDDAVAPHHKQGVPMESKLATTPGGGGGAAGFQLLPAQLLYVVPPDVVVVPGGVRSGPLKLLR